MSTVPTFASPREAREAVRTGLGYLADEQRSLGNWLVHMIRVTRAQAARPR